MDYSKCQLDENCRVVCVVGKDRYWPAIAVNDMPPDLRKQYDRCHNLSTTEEEEEEFVPKQESPMRKVARKLDQSLDLNSSARYDEVGYSEVKELLEDAKSDLVTTSKRRRRGCEDDPTTMDVLNRVTEDSRFLRRAIEVSASIPGVRFVEKLGEGAFGLVLLICSAETNEKFACKIKKQEVGNEQEFQNEYDMQMEFARLGLAPQPLGIRISDWSLSFFVMSKIDGVLSHYLSVPRTKDELDGILQQIVHLMVLMCENNLQHNDFHWGNIGYVIDIEPNRGVAKSSGFHFRLQLLDFGYAKRAECDAKSELAQLIRTALIERDRLYGLQARSNYIHIINELLQFFEENYELPLPINEVEDNIFFWDTMMYANFYNEEWDLKMYEDLRSKRDRIPQSHVSDLVHRYLQWRRYHCMEDNKEVVDATQENIIPTKQILFQMYGEDYFAVRYDPRSKIIVFCTPHTQLSVQWFWGTEEFSIRAEREANSLQQYDDVDGLLIPQYVKMDDMNWLYIHDEGVESTLYANIRDVEWCRYAIYWCIKQLILARVSCQRLSLTNIVKLVDGTCAMLDAPMTEELMDKQEYYSIIWRLFELEHMIPLRNAVIMDYKRSYDPQLRGEDAVNIYYWISKWFALMRGVEWKESMFRETESLWSETASDPHFYTIVDREGNDMFNRRHPEWM